MAAPGNRICGFTQKMPRNARTCAKPLAIDLSENAQNRMGDIFGVLKAEASEKNCEALAAHIEDALVRGIFEALRKLPEGASQETVLEAAVAKVNDALYRLLGEDGLSLGPETISGAIVSQNGKDISAAVWGRPAVLLFHPNSHGQVSIYDLTDDGTPTGEPGHGFSQIISGRITGSDRLLVGSDDLRNPLGDELLSRSALRDTPSQAVEAIRRAMADSRLNFSMSLFVSDSSEWPAGAIPESCERPEPQKPSAQTEKSIERLIATESQTEEIMSPPIIRSIAKKTAGVIKEASRPNCLQDQGLERPQAGGIYPGRGEGHPQRRFRNQGSGGTERFG